MHRGDPAPAAVIRVLLPGPCRAAVSLFTVIPVPGGGDIGAARARVVLWLPAVGALLAVPAAGLLLAVEAGQHAAVRRLLAAALAIAVLAVLTGGLHLDGLADCADGLGSRRPRAEALAIMRRPDIGPFGVVALVFVIIGQISALAAIPAGPPAAAGLLLAVLTGRVCVVLATGPAFPPARQDGLGTLVAGGTSARARAAWTAVLLAAACGAAAASAGAAVLSVGATIAGLLAGLLLCRAAMRRLGGLTGDVYGAVVELSTAAVLLVLAAFG